MNSIDVNVLLAATYAQDPRHDAARACLEHCRQSSVGLSVFSQVAASYVRIATDPRLHGGVISTPQALEFLGVLLEGSGARIVEPGRGHWERFTELVAQHGFTRGDVTDAWLAAAAMDARATWYSFDRSFARFRGLRWADPATTFGT